MAAKKKYYLTNQKDSMEKLTAKEFLQNKYPNSMKGVKWNSNNHIDDNWVANMMEEYANQQRTSERSKEYSVVLGQKGIHSPSFILEIFQGVPKFRNIYDSKGNYISVDHTIIKLLPNQPKEE